MHALTHWPVHAAIHVAILTITILAIARLLSDVEVKGAGAAIAVAVVFSVLNFALGWLLKLLLFVPALLTLGLLFLFIPFIVNVVLLWLTDKLIASFEIKTGRALLISAAVISVVNWLVSAVFHNPRFLHLSG
jgi:putative membrane protein